jgi:hypothetical protein
VVQSDPQGFLEFQVHQDLLAPRDHKDHKDLPDQLDQLEHQELQVQAERLALRVLQATQVPPDLKDQQPVLAMREILGTLEQLVLPEILVQLDRLARRELQDPADRLV